MKEIAQALLETQSVLIRPEEPFQLASGRFSPVYVDCRRLISFPQERALVVEVLARVAREQIGLGAIDLIAGGETAGIPFAAFLALELKKPMIYVRKAPKGHGQVSQIEGVLKGGQRVLLVEDLVTDGSSKLVFVQGIKAAGGVVKDCLCVFEYYSEKAGLTEARTRLRERGITLYSLTNWDELLELLLLQKKITAAQQERVWTFLCDPEGYAHGQH